MQYSKKKILSEKFYFKNAHVITDCILTITVFYTIIIIYNTIYYNCLPTHILENI